MRAMSSNHLFPSDVAFSPSVKAVQTRLGSRKGYARVEHGDGWSTTVTLDLAAFVAAQTRFLLGSASADGQPYIQHRGGPAGFLRVLDATTLAFADLRGNRQYITMGNLAENPKVIVFLIDYAYAHQQRIKLWGTARVVEDESAMLRSLQVADEAGVAGRPERCIVISLTAWDANCPQHITQRLEAADVAAAVAARDRRIAELEPALATATAAR